MKPILSMMAVSFLASAVTVLLACPTTTPPSPGASANLPPQQQSQCVVACSRLSMFGCVEGTDSHCVGVCEHTLDAGLTPLDVECIINAESKSVERTCAGIKCP